MIKLTKKTRSIVAILLAVAMIFAYTPSFAWAETDDGLYSYGTATETSTFNTEGGDLTDSFYFSPEWLMGSPTVRNDSLALLSMQLTAATAIGGEDGYGGDFLRDLGFTGITMVNAGNDDPDSCNYMYARRSLPSGDRLVIVVIQSYSDDNAVKDQGWTQNFIVNGPQTTEGEHYAFALAADKVIHDIQGIGSVGTTYWVTGQSRGGALASLIAKRLHNAGRPVFCYTFESPNTVDEDYATDDYGYIHNYICRDDIVTKIPMWGMTRYGNVYEIKDDTDEFIVEELQKICSEAAEYDVPDSEWIESDIVEYLGERVPTRADYSLVRTDSFTDLDTGEAVSFDYSYQETFVNLMDVIFSGQLSGLSGSLMDSLGDLVPAVDALVNAVSLEKGGAPEAEFQPYYWQAATSLGTFLNSATDQPLTLTAKDLYVLLKLAGPFAVDTEYEPSDDPEGNILGYLNPALNVGMSVSGMTYSHHFDMCIARLKALAPAPDLNDIDILIDSEDLPAAGDSLDKTPADVAEFFEGDDFMDIDAEYFITPHAAWDTEDAQLQDGSVYYLTVSLEVVGHTVPEDFALTINGEDPVSGPDVTYENGVALVTATFQFTVGDPAELTVSFDAGGKMDDPEAITVQKGTALSTLEAPSIGEVVEVDGVKYMLEGWYAEDGTAWDQIKVGENMTVTAKWLLVVDLVELFFNEPALGDPIEEATTPADAPYYIDDQYCSDPEYETATEAWTEGEYSLYIYVRLKDPENSVFLLGEDEWGNIEYLGEVTMNGQEYSDEWTDEELYYRMGRSYDADSGCVQVSFYFPVTGETEEAEYTVVEGGDQTWTKGSDSAAVFKVKRSLDDGETIRHFVGVEVDGQTVDPSNYTAEAGSVVLTVKPAYLETLSVGTHKLTVNFDDGKAQAQFTVAQASNTPAKTGDVANLATYVAILAISLLALTSLRFAKKH